jgi:hypothetical protein
VADPRGTIIVGRDVAHAQDFAAGLYDRRVFAVLVALERRFIDFAAVPPPSLVQEESRRSGLDLPPNDEGSDNSSIFLSSTVAYLPRSVNDRLSHVFVSDFRAHLQFMFV